MYRPVGSAEEMGTFNLLSDRDDVSDRLRLAQAGVTQPGGELKPFEGGEPGRIVWSIWLVWFTSHILLINQLTNQTQETKTTK
jgi:hypothetical protein